jgi:hypothetical protein
MQSYSVYYLHFNDDRGVESNWNKCQDFVCCVMADSQQHAIEQTTYIALNQNNAKHIKVLGIGYCKEEWTKEPQPMRTNEQEMRAQLDSMFERIQAKK